MVALIRIAHGAVSAFFLGCLGYVYYCAIRGKRNHVLIVASGALLAEGTVVAANGGECPLGGVHRRYGDQKTFFELLMPKVLADSVVPFFAFVVGFGIAWAFRPHREPD